jgi:hypothetical protein
MSLTTVHKNLIQSPYRKNIFINGNMEIYQRRTSYTGQTGSTAYIIADRWISSTAFDGSLTSGRSTGVPTGQGFLYSNQFYIATADTSLTSDQWVAIIYYIEGYDFNFIKGKRCTLSFWAWTNKPGSYGASFRDNAYTYTYMIPFTLPSSTWTKVIAPVTFNSPGGTFDSGNGIGCIFAIILAGGSNLLGGNPNVWIAGNKTCPPNQVNFADTIGNDFYITGVQLEVGDSATDYEFRSKAEEISLCQRYYEKSYPLETVPGTYPLYGGMSWRYHVLTGGTTSYAGQNVRFNTEKRATPTVTVYSPHTGASGTYHNFGIGSSYSATVVPIPSGFYWYSASAYTATATRSCAVQWVANAEIGGY